MSFPETIELAPWGFKEWTLIWSDWEGIYTETFTGVNRLEQRVFKLLCIKSVKEHGFTLIAMHYGHKYRLKGEI
jgi:hypothetical protein